MFEQKSQKNNKKLWITLLVILILVAIMIVMQTQIIVMLKDFQTSLFGGWVMDINPLPPAIGDIVKDVNPLPPMYIK